MPDNTDINPVAEGLKIAAELFVLPGTSLLLKKDFKRGFVHLGAGVAARAAFGPPGMVVAAANSYCTARTGKSLIGKFLSPNDVATAASTDEDARDTTLREHVYKETAQGTPLNNIKEGVVEDVEDLYHEAMAQEQKKGEAETRSAHHENGNDSAAEKDAQHSAKADPASATE